MPITRLMLLEIIIVKLWNIIPHWTSRFEIYPKRITVFFELLLTFRIRFSKTENQNCNLSLQLLMTF
jgi:hypothetical protein